MTDQMFTADRCFCCVSTESERIFMTYLTLDNLSPTFSFIPAHGLPVTCGKAKKSIDVSGNRVTPPTLTFDRRRTLKMLWPCGGLLANTLPKIACL
jgi:hypothetical protein